MKPLSKPHAEAVAKAKTDDEKVKAAAVAMIETPMKLIRSILLKHEQAVIEVMKELSDERDRAAAAEREECAKASEAQIERWVDDRARYAASECAAAIRARGQA